MLDKKNTNHSLNFVDIILAHSDIIQLFLQCQL